MILLLDIGNTRTKWGLHDGCAIVEAGAFYTREAATAGLHLSGFGTVVACNVANREAETIIERALAPAHVRWLRPAAACCGVTNGYRDPERLGADRFAALIAAHARQASPCVVVAAGTAITVDLLASHAQHLGGIIIPGLGLMRETLNAGTAGIHANPGALADIPDNTDDAVTTGSLRAASGAIGALRERLRLSEAAPAPVLITGGDAATLAPLLAPPVEVAEHLVLEGLAVFATQ
jgi:type III pantothenate kinase